MVEASGKKARNSGSASKQAVMQMNAEQSLEKGNADAELVRKRRRPMFPREGEQWMHWGKPPGYWATTCLQREMHQHGRPIWLGAWRSQADRPLPCEGRSGIRWESDRSIVPGKSEKGRWREGTLVQGKRPKEREQGDWQ
ncbi:hypothetical protein A7K73_03155 [Candidatus Methylacidiphilum fumarolicum]|nr:hypothetical protein A7K73_03155 [Candidatus Methylacidiphilum fumarolicum]TFE77112.1 hypothetical protein A7D33_00430 [Candidatus Methylacidiphilum fumarolicum]